MAKPTLHDRLVAALLARGERIVEDARTTRYTVLARDGGGGWFTFVGKAGALRIGRTATDSRPVAESVRRRLHDGARGVDDRRASRPAVRLARWVRTH